MKQLLKKISIRIFNFYVRYFVKRIGNLSLKSALVIAPHPDDEIFGLGGLILKLIEEDCKVYFVFLTDGENSGVWHDKEEIRKQRINSSSVVCSLLGLEVSKVFRFHMNDGNIPKPGENGYQNALSQLIQIIETKKPDAVFTTHTLDYWPFDHIASAALTKEAVLSSSHQSSLFYFWVWTWYNLRPLQVNKLRLRTLRKFEIGAFLKRKNELAEIYLKSLAPNGKAWCGVLPEPFLEIIKLPVEVVEQII